MNLSWLFVYIVRLDDSPGIRERKWREGENDKHFQCFSLTLLHYLSQFVKGISSLVLIKDRYLLTCSRALVRPCIHPFISQIFIDTLLFSTYILERRIHNQMCMTILFLKINKNSIKWSLCAKSFAYRISLKP